MEVQKIPLSLVLPSPMNPRKNFSEAELQELADNIEKQGLLQPITVRPIKHPTNEFGDRPDKYEIVCGERRYRAFKELSDKYRQSEGQNQFDFILAIVRDMTDDEAFDAMITENLQRKDVDPMDEAFAFGKLIDKGSTVDEIAARFGKSIRFIQDRVKLNSLIPELMVAVKDGKMPIITAQIISKLDEEQQKQYFKTCGKREDYNSFEAKRFVRNLFMDIAYSLWMKAKMPEFEGSCGLRCSECQLNTANHGCLFYEMKPEGSGQCTNREKFTEKTLSFVLDVVDANLPRLVKSGEQYEIGKTVLALNIDSNETGEAKDIKMRLKALLEERGLEVANTSNFKGRCWYDADDERTINLLKEGKVVKVINLARYATLAIDEEFWYVKTNGTGNVVPTVPSAVTEAITKLKNHERGLEATLVVASTKALYDNRELSPTPLTDTEKRVFSAIILDQSRELREKRKIEPYGKREDVVAAVESDPALFNQCVRFLIAKALEPNNTPGHYAVAPFLEELGTLWCETHYKEAKDKAAKKFDKTLEKLTKRLAELGYDEEGNPIPTKVSCAKSLPLQKQFEEMKVKHPDAILLFRVGDFYEAFYKDAEDCAEILGITLTKRKEGKKEISIAGFPHHALDTYLPRIIRAGRRAAICEQQEDPKK